ncbi:mucin-17 isoform X2 [Orussus abietinus]|uniref:mucin-17 isoform X2 n=1 Tax=Orussus abietinus TaxID=222816 RepID=UPI000626E979|nr:mucin-17 isoform X2 [Orussus abietinus]
MCEQTEINYLDGDIVWVKLSGCWWPGQVTSLNNLSEDIRSEFRKKPLIAVVKFFQEDTYEFVKNYQQIYKYNCTLKDDFIKKGLDKYRTKSKDGSTYMNKFPGDVEMAEKLTGGDPDILRSERFSPEEKPDISALFGEKKLPKKKRDTDGNHRRSDGGEMQRKITHPRFLRESDHEIRIRQQPSSLPSTPNNSSPLYPCHLCSFTSSRVNVIICHIKSHRSGNSPVARTKVKTYSQSRTKVSDLDTPKRKNVKKEKSYSHKNRSEGNSEPRKRKPVKQVDKSSKKKKTDPEIREKLLADWDDGSDEDAGLDDTKPLLYDSTYGNPPAKYRANVDDLDDSSMNKDKDIEDSIDIIQGAERLLRETEQLSALHAMENSLSGKARSSSNKLLDQSDNKFDSSTELLPRKNISLRVNDEKQTTNDRKKEENQKDQKMSHDKDDKKSKLSCFDFDEDDLPEPALPPVRKIPRLFGEKNLKKEIIKEFEMSQALKNEQEKETLTERERNLRNEMVIEVVLGTEAKKFDVKNKESDNTSQIAKIDGDDIKITDKIEETISLTNEETQKSNANICETEVEIVEIFEVEREEEAEVERSISDTKDSEKEISTKTVQELNDTVIQKFTDKPIEAQPENSTPKQTKTVDSILQETISEPVLMDSEELFEKEPFSDKIEIETEDETVSESAETVLGHSENSDTDGTLPRAGMSQSGDTDVDNASIVSTETKSKEGSLAEVEDETEKRTVKRRRGRPKKSIDNRLIENRDISSKRSLELNKSLEVLEKSERVTSESDTERSLSGRRRKPNKKYLESDIYMHDQKAAYKTDESQSETDDKSQKGEETPKPSRGKLRRGKRSYGFRKKSAALKEEIGDYFESQDKSLGGTDETSSMSTGEEKYYDEETKSSSTKVSLERDKKQSDIAIPESPMGRVETFQGITKLSSVYNEVVNEVKLETKTSIPEGQPITEKEIKEGEQERNDLKTNERVENNTEENEPFRQLEVIKTSVDMLPPKKSQIKKFELSQLDFFDNDPPNKNALQPAAESRIDNLAGIEIEITRVDPNEGMLDTLMATHNKSKETAMEPDAITKSLEEQLRIEEVIGFATPEEKSAVQAEVTMDVESETSVQIEVPVHEKVEVPPSVEELAKDIVNSEIEVEASLKKSEEAANEPSQKSATLKIKQKGKFLTEAELKKDQDGNSQEKPINTFQEAFLKTLQMDKRGKKAGTENAESVTGRGKNKKVVMQQLTDGMDNANITGQTEDTTEGVEIEKLGKGIIITETASEDQRTVTEIAGMTEFEGVEVVVEENIAVETKLDNTVFQDSAQMTQDVGIVLQKQDQMPEVDERFKPLTLEKLDETSRLSMSTPSPTSEIGVPVKKREKPRIIENVTLKEPMQILKTKLLEKLPPKGTKHKLESETLKKGDSKGSSRAKVMKLDSTSPNSKPKTPLKSSGNMSLTQKLQALKAEEAATAAAMEVQNEKVIPQTGRTISAVPIPTLTEKYIQQSSQSLADMDLDINSMPFVLSEDVLTPESIEQMPVVIPGHIIPTASTITTPLTLTPASQIVATNQSQFKVSDSSSDPHPTPSKKKSGTPTILKNKGKAKPTITSIKTLVPPLTGGVKGLKFQNTQAGKSSPLLSQKGNPGKYVIVQTAGGQQLRYSVQGKPGTQQKIAIPAGKGTPGSAQIVHQGGKVVILTSAQSGQTKMLPLNISKSLSGKVQRVMTSKGQIFSPISPQGLVQSKTVIAPKTEGSASATTSKVASSQKIINAQGIITSKGVLTPIQGTISKSALLSSLSQGLLTKSGLYTPISASPLAGKTIIGSKTLVTKGTTILSPLATQNLVTSKAILTPISQAITGKTILSTQGIVSSKGTVLTPITGQQVKAIAAKSPSKGGKIQYQTVQQKMQLPMLQKCQKIPISSSQVRVTGTTVKSPQGGTIVFQNTVPGQKTILQGKKATKHTLTQQTVAVASLSPQVGVQQAASSIPQGQLKSKVLSTTSAVQKVVLSKGSGRQQKAQQKIVVQKMHQESVPSSPHTVQTKPAGNVASLNVCPVTKPGAQHRQLTSNSTKLQKGGKNVQQQKTLMNMALNTVATTPMIANLGSQLPLPPLEPIEPEKKAEIFEDVVPKEEFKPETHLVETSNEANSEKIDEPKVTAQPQIMALPTESSDGTQTYVLVTIDDQGQIQPLDNNTLMSLEGTTQNPDGTRTLYIDPSSLGETGGIDNIVLQFDNGCMSNMQSSVGENPSAVITESFPTPEVIHTSNQDILAAALANTDFQQEIGLPENSTASVMSTGLTQTNLINQTILQSTIIPPTEPISSPSVLETSLTLNQPIMTPLEVPTSLPIQEPTRTSVVPTIPSSLELPITIASSTISYISASEAQIQIPGNSMPDIGEIMESPTSEVTQAEIPASTQYLVIPNLEENITIETQDIRTSTESVPSVSYAVSIPESIVLEGSQVQTTPSMPIIDDTFTEETQFSAQMKPEMSSDQSFVDVSVSEMLVSKVSTNSTESNAILEMTVNHEAPTSSQKTLEISEKIAEVVNKVQEIQQEYPQEISITTEEFDGLRKDAAQEEVPVSAPVSQEPLVQETSEMNIHNVHPTESSTSGLPIIGDSCMVTSELISEIQLTETSSFEVSDSSQVQEAMSQEAESANQVDESTEKTIAGVPCCIVEEQAAPSDQDEQNCRSMLHPETMDNTVEENMEVETPVESEIYTAADDSRVLEVTRRDEPSSQGGVAEMEVASENFCTETSQEVPSQSYEEFEASVTSDSVEVPSQSANKSESLGREVSRSENDEVFVSEEQPTAPTQSFEDAKSNRASQSYDVSEDARTNAPTQSFNEIMQTQEGRADETADDPSFPTQSYEVGKVEGLSENMEIDPEISQEGANEDETASSSYVPETPETQERDQDQESAISTSSYEIPPCEELNIASSSVIPDTSVREEHTSIHDNGVPEIPTSSYNLNPDSSSTHVDAVPTSSYEDHVIVEQNVSTSYEVPISMPGLEESSSQNFVTESSDHRRNEPTSYYGHHHREVTPSYYESIHRDSNSRLEASPQEEVTPGYYEASGRDVTSEASQSYFAPEEATPSFSRRSVSPGYYEPRPETEASQSYYSGRELERAERSSTSSSGNIEASQSFYQETADDSRLGQRGEATPTYSERYPVDYTLANSPIERHDLVESSVPAPQATER